MAGQEIYQKNVLINKKHEDQFYSILDLYSRL